MNKATIIIVGIVILIGAGYWWMQKNNNSSQSSNQDSSLAVNNNQDQVEVPKIDSQKFDELARLIENGKGVRIIFGT